MKVGKWIVNIIFLECFSAFPQPSFTVFDTLPDDYFNEYYYEEFEEDMAKDGILQAREEFSDYELTNMASPRAVGGPVRFLRSQELMWRELFRMDNTQCSVELNKTEVPDYMLCSPGGACFVSKTNPRFATPCYTEGGVIQLIYFPFLEPNVSFYF
uniref:Putative trypsin-like serine protease n=1 Tax=Ixodes ricinus TaxID=34613 RepID=A0A6B0UWE0_IXORI